MFLTLFLTSPFVVNSKSVSAFFEKRNVILAKEDSSYLVIKLTLYHMYTVLWEWRCHTHLKICIWWLNNKLFLLTNELSSFESQVPCPKMTRWRCMRMRLQFFWHWMSQFCFMCVTQYYNCHTLLICLRWSNTFVLLRWWTDLLCT